MPRTERLMEFSHSPRLILSNSCNISRKCAYTLTVIVFRKNKKRVPSVPGRHSNYGKKLLSCNIISDRILMVSNCSMLHATHPVTIISNGMQVFYSLFFVLVSLPWRLTISFLHLKSFGTPIFLDFNNRYLDWTTRINSFAVKFTNLWWCLQYDFITIGFQLRQT